MKNGFAPKGTDTYFKTASEAAEYASKKLKKEIMNAVKLESKGAKASMLLFFKINLESKKGLYYAREFVKYYGAEQIKMISKEIRKRKEWVKDWQRKYSELEV